jgi:hypothetical protein
MWTLCPHNPPNLERGARRGRFRLPPNERRRLLARFTYDHGADWPLDWRVNAVGEGAALTDIAFEPVSSNRSLRCRETEFSGQRQTGRNGLGDSRTPVRRQNLARQLRQFGPNRGVPGNLRYLQPSGYERARVSGASQRCACWPRIKFDQYARYRSWRVSSV